MVTANVNKRTTESKYVTCFADARPDVDITFRDVLLSRPTDHYLVGVDNFSLTSTGLSMIEPLRGDYANLLRIVRNRPFSVVPAPFTPDALDTAFQNDGLDVTDDLNLQPDVPGYDFTIKTTEVILSIQQMLHRLTRLAATVNQFMQTGKATLVNNFDGEFSYLADPAGEDTEHLRFEVRSDGKLLIIGTRAFWGCFSIEVPSPQYQYGFWGDRKATDDNPLRMRRFLSLNPQTGVATFSKILVNNVKKVAAPGGALTDAESAYNRRTVYGDQARFVAAATVINDDGFKTHAGPTHKEMVTVETNASLFSTLERRVALELSCSLPIKNSPMIDHQRETPDFVLARWIWRTDGRVDSNGQGGSSRYSGVMPACIEYQGAQDRITYHELQAQAKIQTLRIKLFARVRFFNETDETWSMRVVELPTNNTDWWHSRLHFVSKD